MSNIENNNNQCRRHCHCTTAMMMMMMLRQHKFNCIFAFDSQARICPRRRCDLKGLHISSKCSAIQTSKLERSSRHSHSHSHKPSQTSPNLRNHTENRQITIAAQRLMPEMHAGQSNGKQMTNELNIEWRHRHSRGKKKTTKTVKIFAQKSR